MGVQTWPTETFDKRRLHGRQMPMGWKRSLGTSHDKLQAAKQAAPNALEKDRLAVARLTDATAFAAKALDSLRAAKQEAAVTSGQSFRTAASSPTIHPL